MTPEDRNPDSMDDLILGFEDLEAEEKARVLRFLEGDPEQAARLEHLQALEGLALGELPVDQSAWDEALLDAEESRQQEESLRRILAALEEQFPAHRKVREDRRPRRHRLPSRLNWALPLAAVLALFIVLPLWQRGGDPLPSPRVVVLVGEEGTRGFGSEAPSRGVLHTGQAFALDFHLEGDSHVLVYHLDPAGRLALVWPADPGPETSSLAGGRQHRVPRAENDEVWVLGPETGTESFLVVSFGEWTGECLDLEPVAGLARRADVLADLKVRLEGCRGRVELIEFDHRD